MSETRIPLAGVIGAPIAHSRSPALHRHWLERHARPGHYVPLHVEEADLKPVLRALPRAGFVGVNVTIPHKQAALAVAATASEAARRIGAANLLTFGPDGAIHADNADGIGFLENLRQGAPGWRAQGGPVCLFGAGGAARAVIAALLAEGAPEIRLVNRTRARAEALASAFGPSIRVVDQAQAAQALDGAATVVNSSALGMTGQPPLEISLEALGPGAVVNDLVYTPVETALLRQARAAGCTVVDGAGMLLHQAVPAFEAFFGVRPQVDAAARAVVLGA